MSNFLDKYIKDPEEFKKLREELDQAEYEALHSLKRGDIISYQGEETKVEWIKERTCILPGGKEVDLQKIDFVLLSKENLKEIFKGNLKTFPSLDCQQAKYDSGISTLVIQIWDNYDISMTHVFKTDPETYTFSGKLYFKHEFQRALEVCKVPKNLFSIG